MKFKRAFFLRPPVLVARDLLGAELHTINREGATSGRIVEVEAYGAKDEASHSFRGITKRNEAMFAKGGHCYVYFIYGVHYCVNVVTESSGTGSAVLIRALEPLSGIELMQQRRGTTKLRELTSGPGKVCQALAITKTLNHEDLLNSTKIFIRPGVKVAKSKVSYSTRIGIGKAKDLEWRVFLSNSPYISR